MKRISSTFERCCSILLLLALSLTLCRPTSGSSDNLSPKDREEVFEKVWKEINEHYYDPAFHGVNWREMRERYLPLVEAAKDDEDFYVVVNRMAGELHDAHTRFNTPQQWENRLKQQRVNIGFFVDNVDGRIAIIDVQADSNSARAGIEPGMIVLTVDGQPIAERIAETGKRVMPSSSERITRLRVYNSAFAGAPDTSVKLGLQRADGFAFEATVTRQILPSPPDVVAHLLASGDGYIRFDGFQLPVEKEFKNALAEFHGAPGIIVDLRHNGGGRGDVLKTLAGYFFNRKTLLAEYMTRADVQSSEESSGSDKARRKFNAGKDDGQLYAGPVVLLVETRSGSSSELFAAGLQETGRAKVIGSQTCGCVIGISNLRKMKGGGVLEISEMLWFSSNGRKLEGEGVIPDENIVPTIADLQQKRDPVLEAAEKLIKMSAAKPPASSQ